MKRISTGLLAAFVSLHGLSAHAQESGEDIAELDTFVTEEDINDDLGILQSEPINSVFGFGKSALETPRSVSSVSAEFIDQFDISSINDIATFVPGSFTTSFFGVAGSLDLRGTPGDNYFRGVKRLNNDGVYPTAIGASDRIDVIRGPMSPISGPSRVGGALNFVPKSARAETGAYLEKATGDITYTAGSWGKSVIKGEVGGPAEVAGKTLGYYLFAEVEASDSYYDNDFNNQTLLQGSFNFDLSDSTRVEFGFMYQDWDGHENGGWNRVTQDLIDNGTYITGQPTFTPVDANGDGFMNDDEIGFGFGGFAPGSGASPVACAGDFNGFAGTGSTQLFCFDLASGGAFDPANITADSIPAGYGIAQTGTAKLKGSQVLITYTDLYKTEVETAYFDILHDPGNGWTITNKLFYENVKSANIDTYGFSKVGDSTVFEDQLIFTTQFTGKGFVSDFQASPSVRYVDAYYANDFVDEIFDRVDLTVGFNPASAQSSPIRSSDPWGIHDTSVYTQLGFAVLSDTTFFDSLSVLLGARYDYVDIEAETGENVTFFTRTSGAQSSDTDDAFSYNVSLSYKTPFGIIPYVTYAEQSTILAGTHDAVEEPLVAGGTWFGKSEMAEFGVKANFFDDRLYLAAAVYEQERVSINSNVAESNEALKTDGYEFEIRYLPTDDLTVIAGYTHLEVVRTDLGGSLFTFLGASDVPQIDPALIFGGVFSGNVIVPSEPNRGGIPENVYSLAFLYDLSESLSTTLSTVFVDEVEPSPLGGLVLPSYTIVNLGLRYNTDTFAASFNVNNLLDEEYFRANFPGLYGNLTVLPEKPRNYTASITFKF